MYIYPDNLKAKAMLGLWQIRDIGIIGISLIISVLTLTQIGFIIPLIGTAVYGFLSIRFSDTSILDFIKYAGAYFIAKQQIFEWRMMKS